MQTLYSVIEEAGVSLKVKAYVYIQQAAWRAVRKEKLFFKAAEAYFPFFPTHVIMENKKKEVSCMESILSNRANISEEEKMNMLRSMTGQKLDGTVNYSAVSNTALMEVAKRERAKQEMLAYMMQCVGEEYGLTDSGEILLKWEDYKEKHSIEIKEHITYE